MNNKDPRLDKNYWAFLIVSMTILLAYPMVMRKFAPQNLQPQPRASAESSASPDGNAVQNPGDALTPAQGSFLEKSPEASVITFENERYRAQFSTRGGVITYLFYEGEENGHQQNSTLLYEAEPDEPGLFGIRLGHDEADLTNTFFKFRKTGTHDEIMEFSYEKPGDFRVTKRFILASDTSAISLDVDIENLSTFERHFPIEITQALNYKLAQRILPRDFQVVYSADKIDSVSLDKILKRGFSASAPMEWSAIIKKYFTIIVKPDAKGVSLSASADEDSIHSEMMTEPLTVLPGQLARRQFLIYAGPQRYETLKAFDAGFEHILSRGFFGLFKIWLLLALKFCYGFTHNFGVSIILLTLLLKGLFTPLTHMSFESMKKMQVLQPKLKSLQERYKNDPGKLNKEMMELYKRNRVNPMAGCLPMLVQIPIFIAFYQVLNEAIELKGAPFFGWIMDLSEPDRFFTFPFTLPVVGSSLNILPFFMIASMVWQQKLTPQAGATPEQTKIFAFMPLIFGVFFYTMPSGLVLYWFVNNCLSVIHQTIVKRMVIVLHHEDKEN